MRKKFYATLALSFIIALSNSQKIEANNLDYYAGIDTISISGHVTYDNYSSSPLCYVQVILKRNDSLIHQVMTGQTGYFKFHNLGPGTYTLDAFGTQFWGGGNASDGLLMLKHFAGHPYLTGLKKKAGDVTGDSVINAHDALNTLRRFAGLLPNFYPVPDWVFEHKTMVITSNSVSNIMIKGLCYGDVNGDFVPSYPFSCGNILIDERDNQAYNTISIGTQCWMKENMNAGIQIYNNQNSSNNGIIEKRCYNDLPDNCNIYGGLYNWFEMMQYSDDSSGQGICPLGWHIPTVAQFCILFGFLDTTFVCNTPDDINGSIGHSGTDAGGKTKETGNLHWSNNYMATNTSGFTALGAGYRVYYGSWYSLKLGANFWTSSSYDNYWAPSFILNSSRSDIEYSDTMNKYGSCSVRCLKD